VFDEKPKATAKWDTWGTFIGGRTFNTQALKVGAEFNETLVLGVGYNWLSNGVYKNVNVEGVNRLSEFELRYFGPYAELDFFKNHGWENHVVFQFFGNIGRVQGVDNLLKAISLVTSKNAAFVFIGGGAMVPAVEKFIEVNSNKAIKFFGPIPLIQKNKGLAMCDVALVSLEAGMLGLGVPSKSYFSLAAGKPILATVDADSEIGLMLSEFPVGWRCDPSSPQQLANLIDEICRSPEQINEKSPREVFLRNYSENVVLRKISENLRGII
jgi:glycosyltransferase involved in cell wall biosynthesis